MKKAIVIGSGFGGLAIASRLKKHNFHVKLLEKQSDFGGEHELLLIMVLNMMLAQQLFLLHT